MYKCCIFDLDGTLVNSIYAIQKSVNDTLSYWNMREISVEESRLYVGAVERYQDIFRECCMYRVEAYEGIGELLEFLKSQGIFIAVLSNKPHPRTLDNVQGVFGKGYFDLVYGEREDKGIKKKPCPDGVWAIAEELGLSKSEILYLGDTNTDMETGDNAKVDTVGVTWGFRTREELMAFHPALIADHPSQVVQYIKDVNGIE